MASGFKMGKLIALVNERTGEGGQRRLEHASGEAEQFYRQLQEEAGAREYRAEVRKAGAYNTG